MYELADYIIGSLVDNKEQYQIEYIESMGQINIYVAKECIGRVIGKQGRIVKAIRSIFKAAAIKKNIRVSVEVLELDTNNA